MHSPRQCTNTLRVSGPRSATLCRPGSDHDDTSRPGEAVGIPETARPCAFFSINRRFTASAGERLGLAVETA